MQLNAKRTQIERKKNVLRTDPQIRELSGNEPRTETIVENKNSSVCRKKELILNISTGSRVQVCKQLDFLTTSHIFRDKFKLMFHQIWSHQHLSNAEICETDCGLFWPPSLNQWSDLSFCTSWRLAAVAGFENHLVFVDIACIQLGTTVGGWNLASLMKWSSKVWM